MHERKSIEHQIDFSFRDEEVHAKGVLKGVAEKFPVCAPASLIKSARRPKWVLSMARGCITVRKPL